MLFSCLNFGAPLLVCLNTDFDLELYNNNLPILFSTINFYCMGLLFSFLSPPSPLSSLAPRPPPLIPTLPPAPSQLLPLSSLSISSSTLSPPHFSSSSIYVNLSSSIHVGHLLHLCLQVSFIIFLSPLYPCLYLPLDCSLYFPMAIRPP